jgi:nicotinamide riboside transporter PnuC
MSFFITETIGWATTAIAVAGVLLNNRRMRACFCLWWISNAASMGLHLYAGLWALSARDLIFLVLAVTGYIAWGKKAS